MGADSMHHSLCPSNDQSIFMMLDKVMLQVEYHCFADLRFKRIDPFFKELCLIIADVLLSYPDSVIKLNGQYICTKLVQDVFSQIRNRHLLLVFNNFHNVSHRILNKKAYLRTALYNAVFEFEAHFINDVAQG